VGPLLSPQRSEWVLLETRHGHLRRRKNRLTRRV
jgi:hypothetical protein